MPKPTYRDATLMLQIAQWESSMGLWEAMNWMMSDEYVEDYEKFVAKYPHGSEGFLKAVKVCSVCETVGTIYKHGLLNKELLFDWVAVGMVWKRMKGFAIGYRKETGEPRLYENFELLAKDAEG